MESTWARREQPVLCYLVERLDDALTSRVDLDEVAAGTGLSGDDVERALRALAEASPPYVQGQTVAELT